MYASTPQHKIDEESHPGILADMLNSSSSSDDSSSSSDSDTDASSGSNTTAKRIKRALGRRRRRKSSASSNRTPSVPSVVRTPSSNNTQVLDGPAFESPSPVSRRLSYGLEVVASGDEADTDGEHRRGGLRREQGVKTRDFETEKVESANISRNSSQKIKKKKRSKKHKHSRKDKKDNEELNEKGEAGSSKAEPAVQVDSAHSAPRVEFAEEVEDGMSHTTTKRPITFRELSSVRPALPTLLSSTDFSRQIPHPGQSMPLPSTVTQLQSDSGLRRTNSLPDRLNRGPVAPPRVPPSAQPLPHLVPAQVPEDAKNDKLESNHLSRTSAILLLLVSTGLVAVCADFLVDSIDYLVDHTGVSQAFIGLIVLPIVGNAAEHVTAVTVASKNKMDLAIGVALGSSIQIALFVTPVIVLLGWCINVDMSLYFSLFETVSLFVSAFIVNYLMIDGRSNYLEGALLIAAYVIIAVLAFFYPACENASTASGPISTGASC